MPGHRNPSRLPSSYTSTSGRDRLSPSTSSSTSSSRHSTPSSRLDRISVLESTSTRRDRLLYDEDSDRARTARAGSYYETPSGDVMRASTVRRNIDDAPDPGRFTYPKRHYNYENNPLRSNPPHLEQPLRTDGRPYRGGEPGPLRGIYNERTRRPIDVAEHDDSRAPLGPRGTSPHARRPFTVGRYYPGPEYTDLTPSSTSSSGGRISGSSGGGRLGSSSGRLGSSSSSRYGGGSSGSRSRHDDYDI